MAVTSVSAGCGETDAVCEIGTEEVDGECVLSCGPGTVDDGGQCVPIAGGAAPLIASIDPPRDLLGGGAAFTLTGSGFLEPGAGDTALQFAGVAAAFTIASDTEIRGTVPRGVARSVEVTLANGNGADSIGFRYTGLYAGDGKAGAPGNLYLVDPRDGTHIAIGAIASNGGATGHGVTGLAFDPAGVLFASESSTGEASSLLTIDPATGAATVIGPLVDGDTAHASIPDITFAGAALVGWSENSDDVVSIDAASGAVTVLGDSDISSAGSGMTALSDGTVIFAQAAVGSGLFAVSLTDGSAEQIAILASEQTDGLAVCSMAAFQGAVFAVLSANAGSPLGGSSLAAIDPATGEVTPLGALPPGIDALASDEPLAPASGAFVPRRELKPPARGQAS